MGQAKLLPDLETGMKLPASLVVGIADRIWERRHVAGAVGSLGKMGRRYNCRRLTHRIRWWYRCCRVVSYLVTESCCCCRCHNRKRGRRGRQLLLLPSDLAIDGGDELGSKQI
ncbi:hypothetical protein ACLOJK_008014 [Asimina triloba]